MIDPAPDQTVDSSILGIPEIRLIGKTLAHYEITELLGQGGMGEVYRARDKKLDREVAIKVLPTDLTDDPRRVARFEREARTLASVQHPNIASLYGFDQDGDRHFLVMELVEGLDLSQRIAQGPVPREEAQRIALGIATGLEAAHEKGIIHRDLKPANVKIAPNGEVKILDFGLARAAAATDPEDTEATRTVALDMTDEGVILGTAAYMSPEQARGHEVDPRTDLWALGVIVFEMLTGRRLFEGSTASDLLAAVLTSEIPWDALPPETPAFLRQLLRRCLERDASQRLANAGYARLAIEDGTRTSLGTMDSGAQRALADPPRRMSAVAGIAFAILVAGLGIAGALWLRPAGEAELPLRKFRVPLASEGQRLRNSDGPRISPDGRRVAYVHDGAIWVLDLRSTEPRRLDRTEDAVGPFWSPDSRSVGFAQGREIHRIPVDGGARVTMAALDERIGSLAAGGAAWSTNGRIAVGTTFTELLEFPAEGGEVRSFAPMVEDEIDVHAVDALPDGKGWIVVMHTGRGEGHLVAYEPDGTRHAVLDLPNESLGGLAWSPSGHIVFERLTVTRGLWALPFDPDTMTAIGEPFLIAPGGGNPSVAQDGTLVYNLMSRYPPAALVWLDRSGRELAKIAPVTASYPFPSIAPDDNRIVVTDGPASDRDLFVFDGTTGRRQRLTFDKNIEMNATWSPDGRSLFYVDEAGYEIREISADGSGETRSIGFGITAAVSPDGRELLMATAGEATGGDVEISRLPLDAGPSEPTPVLDAAVNAEPGWTWAPEISPDGNYLLYASTAFGSQTIYLTTYPDARGRWEVSREPDAGWPRWNDDMTEIYYTTHDAIMVVECDLRQGVQLGAPRVLFERPSTGWHPSWADGFDVTRDGQRFVMVRPDPSRAADQGGLMVVQNCIAEFE
jgi:serine/threonine protein kinase/sugar lactone lactonase YvrE